MAVVEVERFCEAIHPRLVRFLTLACGDVGVAQELAQDTLVKVCVHWGRVATMAAPEAWCYRVAVNAARSWRRRRRAEQRALRLTAATATQPLEVPGEGGQAVRAALQRLPPRQRATLLLRFYAGLSVRETAAVMRCAEGTVKAHSHKALAALRSQLRASEEDADVVT